MSDKPLMPIATAVWLIDNTSLNFDQIADFCGLHPLQVKGIADGDVAAGVRGIDPIATHQLQREEIDKAQADAEYRMKLSRPKNALTVETKRKGPRYTPVSKREHRPDAILWMVRNHPEITDAQIAKILGTTKTTIQSVRDRTHWNSANLTPQDPVGLGLCSQIELDALVRKAAARKPQITPMDEGATLEPARVTTAREEEADERRKPALDIDKVFANLGGGKKAPTAEEREESL